MQPFPPVENPEEIEEIASLFEQIPARQVSFYDGCEKIVGPKYNSYFADWMVYAMKSASFRPSLVV